MASIERVGCRAYRIVWREGGRGSARKKSCVYNSLSQANAAKAQIEADLRAHRTPGTAAEVMTLAQLLDRYRAAKEARVTERHLDQITATVTALALRHHWTRPRDVTASHAAALGPYHARVMRAILRFADLMGQQIDRRAIAACHSPAPRLRPHDLLTPDQVAALEAQATAWHPADGALVHLIATYGHRAQSLITATVGNIDLPAGTIHLKVKSGDEISHRLLPKTLAILAPLLSGRRQDAPLLVGHLGRAWASGAEASGWLTHSMGTGVLALRRYAITRLLDVVGGDARTVASITGHRTPSLLLNTYARTSTQRQDRALQGLAALDQPGVTKVSPRQTDPAQE
jgi:integrase